MAIAATPLQSTASTTAARTSTGMQVITVNSGGTNATTTTAPTDASSVQVAQFDTANGILTGATVKAKTSLRTTAQVTGTVNGYGSNRTVASQAALAATIATPGVAFTSSTMTANVNCSGSNCTQSASNQTNTASGSIDSTAAVPLANLASYAGTGNVTFTRSASGSTKVTTGSGARSGEADGYVTFGSNTQSNNVYSIVYDYLNFANPSFDAVNNISSIDLDFGSVIAGSSPLTLAFSIFNIGNANSAGVNLDSIVRTNNNADYTSSLANFTDLVAGNSAAYTVTFLPTALGLNSDVFTLNLSDYAPTGSVGTKTYQLKINAFGNVSAPPVVSVPEPEVWAMLIAGFGLTGLGQRRRRARGSVAA